MPLTINIIGAGKLGKTIGHLIVKNNLARVEGIHNTSLASSEAAIAFIGDGRYFPEIRLMPSADITIITTPDDIIKTIGIELSCVGNIMPNSIVMHCSGILTSDVLSAVTVKGGLVASIHPMRSFADPVLSFEQYAGTYCAIEGDSKALDVIKVLFESFGSIVYPIKKDKKTLYHASGVFASNYLITLMQQALCCLCRAEVEEPLARKIVLHLMKGTLTNVEKTRFLQDALTGPIKRGDISTIQNHLAAFPEDEMKLLYTTLGKATLGLIERNSEIRNQLEALFP